MSKFTVSPKIMMVVIFFLIFKKDNEFYRMTEIHALVAWTTTETHGMFCWTRTPALGCAEPKREARPHTSFSFEVFYVMKKF